MNATFINNNILLESDNGWAIWVSVPDAETLAASLAAAIHQAKADKHVQS